MLGMVTAPIVLVFSTTSTTTRSQTPSSWQGTVTRTGSLILLDPTILREYDALSGQGAIGVEFGGTAVTSTSSFGANISPADADVTSKVYVGANPELQWSEGSYRGFFTLTIDSKTLNATFYGMKNTTYSNLDSLQIANFIVKAGENKLSRPVAGGAVQAGIIKAVLDAPVSTTSTTVTAITSAHATASTSTSSSMPTTIA
ncbi:hypothetical protein H0H87_002790 [Tephrocybe sp. NHM501043]|nr:hypothetical protein H0H87_002790 [Tephrocybe sp. NHM501043]